jgi:hypothetical protein
VSLTFRSSYKTMSITYHFGMNIINHEIKCNSKPWYFIKGCKIITQTHTLFIYTQCELIYVVASLNNASLLGKLIVPQLVKIFPAFYRTLKVHHRVHKNPTQVLILSQKKSSLHPDTIFLLRPILLLSSHPRPIKIVNAILIILCVLHVLQHNLCHLTVLRAQ